MSEKRRDQRNRILRNGESQRKDGRYVFKYRDINGQPQFVYSWRLEPTDRLPAGKRDGPALRELEPKIIRDLEDKISPRGGDMTVMELVQKYLRTKTGVRASTRAGYKTVLNLLEKDSFSGIRIDRVKQSDAKVWLIDLQKAARVIAAFIPFVASCVRHSRWPLMTTCFVRIHLILSWQV